MQGQYLCKQLGFICIFPWAAGQCIDKSLAFIMNNLKKLSTTCYHADQKRITLSLFYTFYKNGLTAIIGNNLIYSYWNQLSVYLKRYIKSSAKHKWTILNVPKSFAHAGFLVSLFHFLFAARQALSSAKVPSRFSKYIGKIKLSQKNWWNYLSVRKCCSSLFITNNPGWQAVMTCS